MDGGAEMQPTTWNQQENVEIKEEPTQNKF